MATKHVFIEELDQQVLGQRTESTTELPQTYKLAGASEESYENTSLGPTVKILGVRPLKNADGPSFRIIFFKICNPVSGFSKFLFWIRVLMTSIGAETVSEATAPAIEAIVFCIQVAEL